MTIKKGLLKNSSNPDGYYPYTQLDCVFDDEGNSLETLLETPTIIKDNGYYLIDYGDFAVFGCNITNTMTGVYSSSTGYYFATGSFTIPQSMRSYFANATSKQWQSTYVGAGIYQTNIVADDNSGTTGIMNYYVAMLAAFTNLSLKVSINCFLWK